MVGIHLDAHRRLPRPHPLLQAHRHRAAGVHQNSHPRRHGGGSQRMIEIAKEESFYQQEYCGCVYSLRDSNRHRIAQGRPKIVRGVKFYGRDETAGAVPPEAATGISKR